jgi:hypothetical protein
LVSPRETNSDLREAGPSQTTKQFSVNSTAGKTALCALAALRAGRSRLRLVTTSWFGGGRIGTERTTSMAPRFIARQLSHPSGFMGWVVGKLMNRHNALANEFAVRQLTVQPKDRILEIGFGGGLMIPRLLDMPVHVTERHNVGDQEIAVF